MQKSKLAPKSPQLRNRHKRNRQPECRRRNPLHNQPSGGAAQGEFVAGCESARCRSAVEVFVATGDECFDFAVGDGAFEHPESAVGVHPADAAGPGFLDGAAMRDATSSAVSTWFTLISMTPRPSLMRGAISLSIRGQSPGGSPVPGRGGRCAGRGGRVWTSLEMLSEDQKVRHAAVSSFTRASRWS